MTAHVELDIETFSQKIQDMFSFDVEILPEEVIISVTQIKYKETDEGEEIEDYKNIEKFTLQRKNLFEKFDELKTIKIIGETAISYGNSYEFLVNPVDKSPFAFVRIRNIKDDVKKDIVNNIQYKYSIPSDIFLLYFLSELKSNEIALLKRSISDHIVSRNLEEFLPSNNFFGFLKSLMRRFLTIQISSGIPRSEKAFEDLGNAYLFQLAYNQNFGVAHVRSIEEYLSPVRIGRIRRGDIQEIDPPRRVYVSDLVSHYIMAISTDSPALQFLSFFHIMEYFFERVYVEQLVASIKSEITKPGFSYVRDSDISKLINLISRDLKTRDEEFIFNEQEALKLTIKKFVPDLIKIKEEIVKYNPDLLDHYKNHEVNFSKGDKVDLNDTNVENIYSRLAARIYKSRNSIVHSKETTKPVYIPFKHDKFLFKELPLIRFLSEEIIISSSPNLIGEQED